MLRWSIFHRFLCGFYHFDALCKRFWMAKSASKSAKYCPPKCPWIFLQKISVSILWFNFGEYRKGDNIESQDENNLCVLYETNTNYIFMILVPIENAFKEPFNGANIWLILVSLRIWKLFRSCDWMLISILWFVLTFSVSKCFKNVIVYRSHQ